MSKYTITISADGDTYICDVHKKPDFYEWLGTFFVYGGGGNNFGGGTVTIKGSPDGGTTKLALKDASGSNITSNADDNFTVNLTAACKLGENIKLYASMASSTAPTVKVVLYDNNG